MRIKGAKSLTPAMSQSDRESCIQGIFNVGMAYQNMMQIRLGLDYIARKEQEFMDYSEVCNGTL